MLSEFDLIKRYFHRQYPSDPRFALGNGDDCALIAPTKGTQLAISSDMLVSGRHFFADADPAMLGHKCLAVNLSDLAAMGAKPLGFTLAIALPEADESWLAPFSEGMLRLADQYQCRLIGGDTTKGPLTISITIFGEIPPTTAMRRDAAKVDDDIWISGTLGDARLALAAYWNELALSDSAHLAAARRMHMPAPRIELGMALRGIAHAALDISDGLVGDLNHILTSSQVGASLDVDTLPAGPILTQQTQEIQRQFCLAGGDDYELCFTAPPELREAVLEAGRRSQTPVTRVGKILASRGLQIFDRAGNPLDLRPSSFDHFTSA
ncbi:thiamine-phosphate kinase [Undibacterium fentianense]|uniref:Thiamine-monophosphate kinase n=1 Tax=Undibacterium fentianense TaxID=2828728 RepID=A0A941DYJ8_9BURK|nr:thiamine-phosphate kinase [Undibacterium fentianense]MBR7799135.1 thiamine-phosphate kinase [Undibacterium fentianense]